MPRPNRFDYIRPVTTGRPLSRPQAPKGLSAGAARHWQAIVASRPPEYFDAANRVLLACLCEHIAASDWLSVQINALDPSVPKDFTRLRPLLMMAHRQTVAITSLMTKLRLLPPLKAPRKLPELGYIDEAGRVRPRERHR